MGKLKPYQELNGYMFGVRLPSSNLMEKIDEKINIIEGKQRNEFAGKMIVSRTYTNDPEIFLTNSKTDAAPVITFMHSPRCPFCQSPRCLQRPIGWTKASFSSPDNSIALYYLRVCKCKRVSKYFLNEYELRRPVIKTVCCEFCGSKKLNIVGSLRLKPQYQSEQPRIDRTKFLEYLQYCCQNCTYESILSITTTESDIETIIPHPYTIYTTDIDGLRKEYSDSPFWDVISYDSDLSLSQYRTPIERIMLRLKR